MQDHPGRLGFWAVGVPPSGPMDALTFRLVNRVVGNPDGTAALKLDWRKKKLRPITLNNANMLQNTTM